MQIHLNMRIVLLLLVFMASSITLMAQTDDPWWKRLFRKETVEQQEEVKKDESTIEMEDAVIDSDNTNEPLDSISTPSEAPAVPGHVVIKTPSSLQSLDSLYMAEPPKINGYRIKIYFGELEQARGMRVNYISAGNKDGCYLKQYPPNFAVLVGNYRSQTEAFKRLNELKLVYPGATIVRDEIELSELDD